MAAKLKTLREMADELGHVSAKVLRKAIREGRLKAVFVGGCVGYTVQDHDVQSWLDSLKKGVGELSNVEKREINRQAGVA